MFERFTEPARRAVFWARYEASQFGSEYIETHHLLLGILREHEKLRGRVLRGSSLDDLRAEFAKLGSASKVSTSVDLPLSRAGQRALAFAVEEANIAGSPVIDSEHLLAGLLQESDAASEVLTKRGITLQVLRQEFCGAPNVEAEMRAEALLRAVPTERMPAVLRLLEAVASPRVRIDVATETEQFTITF